MGKKGDLGDFERGRIVGARRAGLSVSKTADLLGFSRTTVSRVYREWFEKQKTSSERQLCGRKSLVDVSGQRRMDRLVRGDRKATVAEITARYNQGIQNTISERTARRTLKQMGYSCRRPRSSARVGSSEDVRQSSLSGLHVNGSSCCSGPPPTADQTNVEILNSEPNRTSVHQNLKHTTETPVSLLRTRDYQNLKATSDGCNSTWRCTPTPQDPPGTHSYRRRLTPSVCSRYKTGKNKWFFQKLRF